ncbi:MAG: hypothetical protein U9R25_02245 [Chloroflexota bacterium]|nr:hypothetical protein [Chloroflexota bacterium]
MTSVNGTSAIEEASTSDFQVELSDEAFEALASLKGSAVVGVSFWDSSLADELTEQVPAAEWRSIVDMDLRLDNGILLELYGVLLYPSIGDDPLQGIDRIEETLIGLVDNEGVLVEVAETQEGGLALVFGPETVTEVVLAVGAWVVSEWQDLEEE